MQQTTESQFQYVGRTPAGAYVAMSDTPLTLAEAMHWCSLYNATDALGPENLGAWTFSVELWRGPFTINLPGAEEA